MFFITFLLYSFVTLTLSAVLEHDEVVKLITDCAEANNVTEEEYNNPEIFFVKPPSEPQLCMVKCMMESTKMIGAGGVLQTKVIADYIHTFNVGVREEIIVCAEEIKYVIDCQDIEKFRLCLAPSLYEN